ncbi:MAG: ATPase, T2SS/T4P/T4SS family, partial [Patescibacteria group bacterium]
MQRKDNDGGKVLAELYEKEAEDLAQIIAKKRGLPYIDLSRLTIDLDALRLVEEGEARGGMLAVFQKVGKKLQIVLTNPDLPRTKEILDTLKRQGYTVQVFLCSPNSLKRVWDRYREVKEFIETKRGFIDISPERIQEFSEKIKNIEDFGQLMKPAIASLEQRHTSEILEIILSGAFQLEASDIHIEPQEAEVRLRIRLDGVLHDVIFIPSRVFKLVLSRIKLISELKLNIHNEAQDGRFTIRREDIDIEIRTSVLPGPYGETVVLRILDPKTISVELQDLGMQSYILEIIKGQLKIPNGMILTTGPTGSGKTTTLYAFVKIKRNPEINIVTIEDPIEYHLIGITQTQVNVDRG